jgi:hypothetical protein
MRADSPSRCARQAVSGCSPAKQLSISGGLPVRERLRDNPVPPRRLNTSHRCYQRVILPLFDAPVVDRQPLPAATLSTPQRDRLTPKERKRRGLARATASSPFLADALSLVPHVLKPGELVLGEDVRVRLEAQGVRPRSPHAWGALISTLIERRVLRETGSWRPMRNNRGGSRRTPEYLVLMVCS